MTLITPPSSAPSSGAPVTPAPSPSRPSMANLTPREIVSELDRYIVGQGAAKRSVAIALRNRWRRKRVPEPLRDEISPKNIIMIGPTGVGKTEIARRLARLTGAPFVKVEASKFTEVGYVGRDVESMVRDLVEVSLKLVTEEAKERVQERAAAAVEERLVDALVPAQGGLDVMGTQPEDPRREKVRGLLRGGHLEAREFEIEVEQSNAPVMQLFSGSGMEEMGINLKESLGGLFPTKTKQRRVTVAEARKLFLEEESAKLVDEDKVREEALERAQQDGIIFLDEIDKVASRQSAGSGPDVSREGVQRDLLPIVEGCTVNTKHGMVRTDHVLFVAAGAFHVASPSDLIPELQGRFPIRVELETLTESDFVRILKEPENALTRQYEALLATEEVGVDFADDGIAEIARVACEVNARQENIGARRLHTVMERLLDEVSFHAPDMRGQAVAVDAAWVQNALRDVVQDPKLEQYIL